MSATAIQAVEIINLVFHRGETWSLEVTTNNVVRNVVAACQPWAAAYHLQRLARRMVAGQWVPTQAALS